MDFVESHSDKTVDIATKILSPDHGYNSTLKKLRKSLRQFQLDYVDLYLVHWPQASVGGKALSPDEHPTVSETWEGVEKVYADGKATAIGVSNFSIRTLEHLEKTWKIVPAVNQVEMHSFLPWDELKAYCDIKAIHLTAYSPIGTSNKSGRAIII